ncbi:MAG: DUF1905 domain-containing protein [Bacteroidia bacterium]|nr:DUF1905 domain-containing protein [Bacteroidia bacterium]
MKPLVNKKFSLEKYPGKGGWTFVRIPKTFKNKEEKLNWKKVRGTIDGFEIRKYHIFPIGNNNGLFLPVKAEIRKHIKKKEGDLVHVILYPDNEPLEIPEEMLLCLQDEPKAFAFFNSLSDSEQKFYMQWIYSAKKEETKIDRLAKTINRLLQGLKLYDKDDSE